MQVQRPDQGAYLMPIAWYFAPPGAKVLDVENAFIAGIWTADPPQLDVLLGEQQPFASPKYDGKNLWGYVGQCRIGTNEQWANGLTAADLAAIPGDVPACCAPARAGQCWFLRNNLAAQNAGLPGVFIDPNWSNAGSPVVAGTLADVPGTALDASVFPVVMPPNPISRRAVMQLITPPLPTQVIPAGFWSIGIGRQATLAPGRQKSLQFSLSLLDATGAVKSVFKSTFPIGPQPDLFGGMLAFGEGFLMPEVSIDLGDALCLEFGFSAFVFPPTPVSWTLALFDSGNIPIPVPSELSNLSPLAELCWPWPQPDPDMPIPGTLVPFAGPAVPTGYLLCDGSTKTAAAFPALFAAIGTTWGSGGPGTFKLPDFRDRTLIGTSPGGLGPTRPTARALADAGGEEQHTLIIAEMPAHSHPLSDPGHSHLIQGLGLNAVTTGGGSNAYTPGSGGQLGTDSTRDAYSGVACATIGGDGPHDNMQPFATVQWLIKT